ncbi:hypothetical protein ACL02T_09815 [Pseudonocardia sp. RS010]|uniref:hypothetical protein n=1 Tax=Pseudonocardia sp. RS010 TaxID=3385979 RepID=UPI0039A3A263
MSDYVIRATDELIGEGQYLLVSTHAWSMGFHSFLSGRDGVPETRYAVLAEQRRDRWLPADPAADWFSDQRDTGRRIWVLGAEEQAHADGIDLEQPSRTQATQPGQAHSEHPTRHRAAAVEPHAGSWQQPDHRFLAELPREPHPLLRRLQHDSPDTPFSGPFTSAADLLRSGRVPAELREAIYQALVQLDDVELIDQATDVDGHTRLALRWHSPHRDRDLLVDPDTGHYAGEHDTVTSDTGRLPAGTTAATTSVLTAVVDHLGDIPTAIGTRRSGVPRTG